MLLRKRPRPPMRRTTSMTQFAGDFVIADAEATQLPPPEQEKASDAPHHQWNPPRERQRAAAEVAAQRRAARAGAVGEGWLETRYQGSLGLSPRAGGVHLRNSGDFAVVETAPFLRACGLCKRRLGPGRDTFMYRGIAFCSLECRQQHINQDERKEKCSLTSIKDAAPASNASEQPGNGETVAAA